MRISLISYFGLHPNLTLVALLCSCLANSKTKRRYSQAGTPIIKVNSSYNPEAHTFSLKIR